MLKPYGYTLRCVLALVVCVASSGSLVRAAVPPAPTLDFSQANISFYGETPSANQFVSNSDWGSVDLSYAGSSQIQYFNLSVDGAWRVVNMPLLSPEGLGALSVQTFNFSLGNTPGTPVSSLSYGYSIGLAPLTQAPASATAAQVMPRQIAMSSSEGGGSLLVTAAPGALVGGVGGFNSASLKAFPNQNCILDFCVPASVSNGLQFLNGRFNLGIAPELITIEAFGNVLGTRSPGGTPGGWWVNKDAYIKRNNIPVKTETSEKAQDVIDALKKGWVVEMGGALAGPPPSAHRASVVGVAALDDGRFAVDVAHDTDQLNPNAGTKVERGIFDPATGRITGIWGMDGGTLINFVIESPVPEPGAWALMGLGLVAMACWVRRTRVR